MFELEKSLTNEEYLENRCAVQFRLWLEATEERSGLTSLHVAAQRGDVNIARSLLSYEANVNCTSDKGSPIERGNRSYTDISQTRLCMLAFELSEFWSLRV